MAIQEEVPDFAAMFPKVFVKEVPEELPPLRKIMHRITLKDPSNLMITSTLQVPHALMPKFEEWINKQLRAGIPKRTSVHGGASMFI